MQRNTFHRVVALMIISAGLGIGGCSEATTSNATAATADAPQDGVPAGVYESSLPDGSVMRLDFHDGGKVDFAMTEGSETNAFAGKWVQNGAVILAEGAEGMTLELRWQGKDLVTNSLGMTLTFARR